MKKFALKIFLTLSAVIVIASSVPGINISLSEATDKACNGVGCND